MTFDGHLAIRSRTSEIVALVSFGVMILSAFGLAAGIIAAQLGMYAAYPMAIGLVMHLSWMGSKRVRAELEPSKGAVRANGAIVRVGITSAKIIPQPRGGPIVELRRRFDLYPARVVLATDEQARSFVREVGCDAREGMTRFTVPPPSGVRLVSYAFALVVALTAVVVLKAFALLLLPVGLWLLRASRRTVTIGTDGILIEGYPRGRFVPFASVESIVREERRSRRGPMVSRGFFVVLRSGERIYLHTMDERLREGMFEGDFLFDAAVTAHRAAAHDATAATALFRGDRKAADWVRELRTVREPRYRVAAVRDDELLAVLINPKAEKTTRAAAAVCLVATGDDGRAKVRVAAEDIAAPELRAAIDAALSDDEEALVRTLDAL